MTEARLPRPLYGLLFAVTFATAVGNLGLVSVMPAIGRALAIPDALIACTFSISALAWAFTSPLWARRSDAKGRKPMLLVGLGGFTFSMGGCALVVVLGLYEILPALAIFAAFALVRSTYGLFGSAAATAAQALVADRSHGAVRVKALSGLAGALSLGTILGPALAPLFLAPPAGLAGPPFAFAAMGALLILLVLLLLPRDRPLVATGGTQRASLWRDTELRPLLTSGLIIASAQAINIYTLGFALIDKAGGPIGEAQWLIGLAMALGAGSGLLAQIGFVNLFNPAPRAMLRGGAATALAGNLLAIAPFGIWAVIAGFVLASFGYGLARPGFSAAASLEVGPERQGAVAGAVSSIAGASIALPPIVAVGLYQYWWSAPFVMAGLGAAWVTASDLRRARMFPWSD
jgi:MFS family permease